ncbi:hypothetical protein NDU88_005681, partial [Pleurodeles waltl]
DTEECCACYKKSVCDAILSLSVCGAVVGIGRLLFLLCGRWCWRIRASRRRPERASEAQPKLQRLPGYPS